MPRASHRYIRMIKERSGALRGTDASRSSSSLTADRFEPRPDNLPALSYIHSFITTHSLSSCVCLPPLRITARYLVKQGCYDAVFWLLAILALMPSQHSLVKGMHWFHFGRTCDMQSTGSISYAQHLVIALSSMLDISDDTKKFLCRIVAWGFGVP